MTQPTFKNKKAAALVGFSAIQECLSRIGDEDFDDKILAQIIVDHELDLRCMQEVFMENLS